MIYSWEEGDVLQWWVCGEWRNLMHIRDDDDATDTTQICINDPERYRIVRPVVVILKCRSCKQPLPCECL